MDLVALLFLVVIGTSIWVLVDASNREGGNALFWFIGCLALWILFFPWYVAQRQRMPLKPPPAPPPPKREPGWHPDPGDATRERYHDGRGWTRQTRTKRS